MDKILQANRDKMEEAGVYINRCQTKEQRRLHRIAKRTIDKTKVRINFSNLKTQILKSGRWTDKANQSEITETVHVYGRGSSRTSST